MNEMTMLGALDRRRHSSRDRPMERGTKEFGSDCDARAVSQPGEMACCCSSRALDILLLAMVNSQFGLKDVCDRRDVHLDLASKLVRRRNLI